MKTIQKTLQATLFAAIVSAPAVHAAPLPNVIGAAVNLQRVAQARSVVRGEVTRIIDATRFDMRPDTSTKTITVSNQGAAINLAVGQVVRVDGTFQNDVFVANSVSVTNSGIVAQGQVDITGVVQSVNGNRNLTLTQTGSTRRFAVQSDRDFTNIARGDTVRVRGTLRGDTIAATEVVETGTNANTSKDVDITGRVVDMESAREFSIILRDNVRYRIFAKNTLRGIQPGDTVRVQGQRRANVAYTIDAESVTEGAGDNNTNTGQGAINVDGTIQKVSAGTMVVVTDKTRAMAAKRYTINFAGINNNAFRKGQRVAVNGILYSNNIVEANSVRVVK